ncbi:hypothetical protein CNECB9_2910003 [Cupriavidus necator]|uniref:Uncharacterized protein n=1 Tax=Cupriavidus necator TaxID=106590 RepID=A0A1K0IFX6_CUPNE|nr:hypothetical protein CNECB9_2910003 [Cupriavidus necator]
MVIPPKCRKASLIVNFTISPFSDRKHCSLIQMFNLVPQKWRVPVKVTRWTANFPPG